MSVVRARLIDLIATNLHFLVREEMTRAEAIELKAKILHPLGLLNEKHRLLSESRAKDLVKNNRRSQQILIDTQG